MENYISITFPVTPIKLDIPPHLFLLHQNAGSRQNHGFLTVPYSVGITLSR